MSMLSGSQALGVVISIVTVSVLTRELSTEHFAAFNFALAVLGIGLTAADPGITTALVRDLAQSPERTDELVSQMMGLRVVLAVVVVLGMWGYAWFQLDGMNRLTCLVISAAVLTQAVATPSAALQARVLVKKGVAIELATRIGGFLVLITAVLLGLGAAGAMVGVVAGELAALATLAIVIRGIATMRISFDSRLWRSRLRLGFSIAGASMLSVLVARMGYMVLDQGSSVAELANFGAASRLPMLLERVPLLALSTIFPVMSTLATTDSAALTRLYRWALVRAALLAGALLVIGIPTAPWVIEIWMGPDYLPAVPALRWWLASTACMYVAVVAGNMLIAKHQTRISLVIWIAATPISVVLNWVWVPAHGAAGAAAAMCVTMAFVLVCCLIAAERTPVRA